MHYFKSLVIGIITYSRSSTPTERSRQWAYPCGDTLLHYIYGSLVVFRAKNPFKTGTHPWFTCWLIIPAAYPKYLHFNLYLPLMAWMQPASRCLRMAQHWRPSPPQGVEVLRQKRWYEVRGSQDTAEERHRLPHSILLNGRGQSNDTQLKMN